jgi:hypothetical protein
MGSIDPALGESLVRRVLREIWSGANRGFLARRPTLVIC